MDEENLDEKQNEVKDDNIQTQQQNEIGNISQEQEEDLDFLKKEIDDLKAENSSLRQQLSEYESIAKRAMADYDNYRKRTEKEKDEILRYANEKLIMDLLPIVDNMERAVNSFKDNSAFKDYYDGINMVLNQIYQLLEKYDVKEINALNEEFNPYKHHAIAQVDDKEHANTVIEVLLKGYTMNDKVIRPSLVKVAK